MVSFFFYSKSRWIHFPWVKQFHFTNRRIEIERYYDGNKYDQWRIGTLLPIVLGPGVSFVPGLLSKRKLFYSLLLCFHLFFHGYSCCWYRIEEEVAVSGQHTMTRLTEERVWKWFLWSKCCCVRRTRAHKRISRVNAGKFLQQNQ